MLFSSFENNYLCKSFSQTKLSNPPILCIENEIIRLDDYNLLIDRFSKLKAAEVPR